MGFSKHRHCSEKEAIDQFLVLLAGGVHVRRHQNRKVSEMVRLFSTTGGKLIQWEKPRAMELFVQREGEKQLPPLRQRNSTITHPSHHLESSAFDCCIASMIILFSYPISYIYNHTLQFVGVEMKSSLLKEIRSVIRNPAKNNLCRHPLIVLCGVKTSGLSGRES